jgi:hypothetical protein
MLVNEYRQLSQMAGADFREKCQMPDSLSLVFAQTS